MKLTTLYEVLHESIKKFSDHIAFSQWRGEDLTYIEVGQRVGQVQQILVSAGLKPGDRVAILSSNMPNWGVCYFAITTSGYTAVPILPDFTTDDIDRIIEHSEAKALFVSDKLYTKVSKTTIDSLNLVVRIKNLSILSQTVSEEGAVAIPKPDDLAVIIYTSGTTSSPKGVMLTQYNISSQTWLIEPLFALRDTDVLLSVLPLSHTYECTLGLIYAFSAGCHVVYLDKAPTVSVLMAALKEVRPTIMIIVPLIIEKIYRARVVAKFTSNAFWRALYRIGFVRRYLHRVAGKKLLKFFGGRIRFLGIGGAKLDVNAEKFLYEAKVPYAIGYGLTETAPLLAGAVGDMVRIGSTGPVLKGIECRLENINTETGQGEIVVKSPSQMIGYYKNEEATQQAFTPDGWFRTGDLGTVDHNNCYKITGRCKNVIVTKNGKNIFPEEMEYHLERSAAVAESLVYGGNDKKGKLAVMAKIFPNYPEIKERLGKSEVTDEEVEALIKEAVDDANRAVPTYKRITQFSIRKTEFVKTTTAKIQRFRKENLEDDA